MGYKNVTKVQNSSTTVRRVRLAHGAGAGTREKGRCTEEGMCDSQQGMQRGLDCWRADIEQDAGLGSGNNAGSKPHS